MTTKTKKSTKPVSAKFEKLEHDSLVWSGASVPELFSLVRKIDPAATLTPGVAANELRIQLFRTLMLDAAKKMG